MELAAERGVEAEGSLDATILGNLMFVGIRSSCSIFEEVVINGDSLFAGGMFGSLCWLSRLDNRLRAAGPPPGDPIALGI